MAANTQFAVGVRATAAGGGVALPPRVFGGYAPDSSATGMHAGIVSGGAGAGGAGATEGTLWDIYMQHGGARRAPLARGLLSDANVALLTAALAAKATRLLGALTPPPPDLTVARCDAFATSLLTTALDMGALDLVPSTLGAANARIVASALTRLSAEASDGARWRAFLEQGVNPAMAPRPGVDTAVGDRRELQHAPLGRGVYSPLEAVAEAQGWYDRFQPYRGLSPRQMSGSDELRIRVIPAAVVAPPLPSWAPPSWEPPPLSAAPPSL